MTFLLKNADCVVTCDDQDRIERNTSIYAIDGQIAYIGPNPPAQTADVVIDAKGMAVYPGLINTHHHLYQIFSRNNPALQKLELFDWLKASYQIWKNVNEDVAYYSALTGLGELLKHGCTTVADHHYIFPKNAGDIMEAQFRAALELGVRLHAARGSMDLSEKDGGLPPESVVQTIDEIMQDSQEAIDKYHDSGFLSMRQVMLAPCSPFSVSKELLKQSAALARQNKVRLHTHLCETKNEEEYTLQNTGMRPLQYMESLDWLGDDVWYAHGIHFNDDDLKLLAQTQTGVAHCPISNMKLSSGICRVPDMLALDIPLGLAVDGSSSNDGSNMLEEMRVAYLLHRLNASAKAPTGYEILKIATRGSARLLGRTDIGALEVGKACDLFTIKLDSLELNGGTLDIASMLSTVGHSAPVHCTVVGGKLVVDNSALTNVSEASIVSDSKPVISRFLNKD